MLRVDLRQLGAGGVETRGTLLPDDPALDGLEIVFEGPIVVEGRLHATDGSSFLWRGDVQATVVGECRRCLKRVEQRIEDHVDVVFSADPDLAEDPSVYVLPADPSTIDVSGAVREEIALRASAFPLCGEDCKGLCPNCGADLNAGPCGCAAPGTNH
jgi:uncharacterized protein